MVAPFVIPAAIAAASAAASLFGNKKPKGRQFKTMAPEQEAYQNQLLSYLQQQMGQPTSGFGQAQSVLQKYLSGSPEASKEFEAPYMRQFQEEILPEISMRYGALGSKSSSGFQQALARAGAGLSERLASLRSGLQLQAVGPALGLPAQFTGAALQSRFNTGIEPGGNPYAQAIAPLAGGLSQGFGQQIGGQFANWLSPQAPPMSGGLPPGTGSAAFSGANTARSFPMSGSTLY